MSDPLEPLGPLALRAPDAERRRADVDTAMQERLLVRVVASVAVGAAVTAAATTAGASAGAGAGASAGVTAGASTGVTAATMGLTAKAIPWVVAAFVAGGGAGAAIHAAVVPPVVSAPSTVAEADSGTRAPRTVPATIPSATVSEAPSLPSLPVGALPSAAVPSMGAPTRVPVASAQPSASASAGPAVIAATNGSDLDLAGERALVDRARAALGRGQSKDALDALDAHAMKYPHGRLSEEREALAVDALARAGRLDEARARATRFRAAFPNSVFGAVVDAAVPPVPARP